MILAGLVGLVSYVLAACWGALRPGGRWGVWAVATGGLGFAAVAVGALAGARVQVWLRLGPPGFDLRFGITPLAAVFVLLISGLGILASVYGRAYVAHLSPEKQRGVQGFVPLFLLSMTLVAFAGNVVAFLVAWEAMSLTSYALVVTDRERPEVVRAGYVYLLMTHIGAVCLTAAMLLLTNATGSMAFAEWAKAAPTLAVGLRSAVFLLMLLGFGSKAALVPLHVWLPRAHPVAPSHVSALMSGVMLKVAVYGMVLFLFQVLGPGPLWWGLTVLGLGLVSALLGVLYALMERDLKRLLAYSSVENIGVVTIGLGVALIAQQARLPVVAAVALVAALYHAVNHAIAKTALFLDAGALQFAGAGRNLDAMGGLLTRLPWTGGSLLAASAAIAALPPFNGFVSEWLTYQALVRLAGRAGVGLALAGLIGVLVLALTAGLVAACFLKVGGVALLGRPRSGGAAQAEEVPAAMHVPVVILAGLALALGLLPGLVVGPLAAVAAAALHLDGGGTPWTHVLSLALPWGGVHLAALAPAAFALVSALAILAAVAVGRRARPAPQVRDPWACGGQIGPEGQYSATAYAKPFRQVFGAVYRPVRSVRVRTAVHPFFLTQVEYEGGITHVFDRYGYGPLLAAFVSLARWGRGLQSGSLRLYLGYLLITLVLLLVFVR